MLRSCAVTVILIRSVWSFHDIARNVHLQVNVDGSFDENVDADASNGSASFQYVDNETWQPQLDIETSATHASLEVVTRAAPVAPAWAAIVPAFTPEWQHVFLPYALSTAGPRDDFEPAGAATQNGSTATRLCFVGGTVGIVLASIMIVLWRLAAQGMEEAAGEDMARQMKAIEVFYVMGTFWTMSRITAIVPQSLALSTSLGQGVAFSGIIIASCYALTMVGTVCSRMLTVPWDQVRNRRCIILFGLLLAVSALLVAASANPPASWGLSNSTRIVILISSRLLEGFFEVMLRILLRTLTYKLTPHSQMVSLSLFRTCALTIGTGTGPLIPWGTHYIFGEVGGAVLLSRSFIFIAAVTACIPVVCYLILPNDLTPLIAAKESVDRAAAAARRGWEGTPPEGAATRAIVGEAPNMDRPIFEAKQSVVVAHLVFSGSRGFVCEALIAATAMILELEFGFPTHHVGFLIAFSFFFGFPVMILLQYLRQCRIASDGQLLCALIAVALAAALLLHEELSRFAVGARHSWVLVLVADALIFACTFNANGVSDGLAMKHAVPYTWFSQANVVAYDVAVNTFFRMFAPTSARLLVDLGGRSLYAAMQLAATGLMLHLSYRIKSCVEEIDAAAVKADDGRGPSNKQSADK